MHETSVTEEINQIEMKRPHVVLLGAGASRAALPDGDANGKRLPLMSDFTEIVPIGAVLDEAGIPWRGRNFEELYSELSADSCQAEARAKLERKIFTYFSSLSLPPEPTLYDQLILSLREKDVVMTFNWDPFLIQAIRRNKLVRKQIPSVLFLHGNVAAGYCPHDQVHGERGATCSRCAKSFEPSSLLYPVAAKQYDDSPAIAGAWRKAKASLKSAFMVTIFGYGAPQSDLSAINLFLEAWGGPNARPMEQIEIIDVRSEDDLVQTWKPFIHTHHYRVHTTAYDSWLFNHPRRTGEAYINQYLDARFIADNPVPQGTSFEQLWDFFRPLVDIERNTI